MRMERLRNAASRLYWTRLRRTYPSSDSLTQVLSQNPNRKDLYPCLHQVYDKLLPESVREHRNYFSSEGRGFGEDAFHAMWWLLIKEYRPKKCIEIGVFRGQVISLWSLCAKLLRYDIEVHGVGPFTAAGDAVSVYPSAVDYEQDIRSSFARFGLCLPTLVKAYSTDAVALAHMSSQLWDLFYVDGSHDYEVVRSDVENAIRYLKPGGLLVMDDSSLYLSIVLPRFAFRGHPGPSKVASELWRRTDVLHVATVGHNNIFVKRRK